HLIQCLPSFPTRRSSDLKLNRSLLLLSRIENEQFIERTDVVVAGTIRQSLEYFEEKQQQLKLRTDLKLDERMTVCCNMALAEILDRKSTRLNSSHVKISY